ncbi:MAG: hypothetical protein Fur0037_14660 [Planctomycetota bacterium]
MLWPRPPTFAFATALAGLPCCAVLPPPASPFSAGTVEVDGRTFPYRLLEPDRGLEGDPGQGRLPLVVFLHGAGERGTDNERQLTWLPSVLAAAENRRRFPCFLLAVQCSSDMSWVAVPWAERESQPMPEQPTPAMRAVILAMREILTTRPVDGDRVYLTGLSVGGYGCWDLAMRMPQRFAAIVPVCGGGDARRAERLRSVPIWIWHGSDDRTVPVEQSRAMVEALGGPGDLVRYTELEGVGHDSWKRAYGPGGALAWMFAQRRR